MKSNPFVDAVADEILFRIPENYRKFDVRDSNRL